MNVIEKIIEALKTFLAIFFIVVASLLASAIFKFVEIFGRHLGL